MADSNPLYKPGTRIHIPPMPNARVLELSLESPDNPPRMVQRERRARSRWTHHAGLPQKERRRKPIKHFQIITRLDRLQDKANHLASAKPQAAQFTTTPALDADQHPATTAPQGLEPAVLRPDSVPAIPRDGRPSPSRSGEPMQAAGNKPSGVHLTQSPPDANSSDRSDGNPPPQRPVLGDSPTRLTAPQNLEWDGGGDDISRNSLTSKESAFFSAHGAPLLLPDELGQLQPFLRQELLPGVPRLHARDRHGTTPQGQTAKSTRTRTRTTTTTTAATTTTSTTTTTTTTATTATTTTTTASSAARTTTTTATSGLTDIFTTTGKVLPPIGPRSTLAEASRSHRTSENTRGRSREKDSDEEIAPARPSSPAPGPSSSIPKAFAPAEEPLSQIELINHLFEQPPQALLAQEGYYLKMAAMQPDTLALDMLSELGVALHPLDPQIRRGWQSHECPFQAAIESKRFDNLRWLLAHGAQPGPVLLASLPALSPQVRAVFREHEFPC